MSQINTSLEIMQELPLIKPGDVITARGKKYDVRRVTWEPGYDRILMRPSDVLTLIVTPQNRDPRVRKTQ